MPTRHVVVHAVENGQSLDVTGPVEVFATADRLGPRPGARYTVEVVAHAAGPVRCTSGVVLHAERSAGTVDRLHTLVIAGGEGARRGMSDRLLVGGVDRLARMATRTASVCTGAFLLAATGRLDGRRATTHWAWADTLATAFPAVTVEPNRIFVEDRGVWSSAGVTAGIDLALELVATDHGQDAAAEVARWLVVYAQRAGGQAQFSDRLARQPVGPTLRDLAGWMTDHPDGDLSVAALAARLSLSPRTFQRHVARETGMTPAEWVEQIRVDAARRALELTAAPIPTIARRCGFGTVSTMYRAFDRQLAVTPAAYRRHFHDPTPRRAS